jgi:hypothetical protein
MEAAVHSEVQMRILFSGQLQKIFLVDAIRYKNSLKSVLLDSGLSSSQLLGWERIHIKTIALCMGFSTHDSARDSPRYPRNVKDFLSLSWQQQMLSFLRILYSLVYFAVKKTQ